MNKDKHNKKRYERLLSESHDFEGETYQYESTKEKLEKGSDYLSDEKQEKLPTRPPIPPKVANQVLDSIRENKGISVLSALFIAFLGIFIPLLVSQSGRLGEMKGELKGVVRQINGLEEDYKDDQNHQIVRDFLRDIENLKARVQFLEDRI